MPDETGTYLLNLDQLRSLEPTAYALRLFAHPDTPIIVSDRCSLHDLRIAVRARLRHERAEPSDREGRVTAAHEMVARVERSPAAMREAMNTHYWRSGMASTTSGRVAVDLFNSMLDMADEWERGALRWNVPLPVPEYVHAVRDRVHTVMVMCGVIKPYIPEGDPASWAPPTTRPPADPSRTARPPWRSAWPTVRRS